MHELTLIQNIIEIVLAEMQKHQLTRIDRICLRIGELRQIVPSAMQFSFHCLNMNTPLENAELIIEILPIKGICRGCNKEFLMKNFIENCQFCGSSEIEIISGKELEIKEIEGR
jgi:hydrogenase nickel incorporation protein HypA/HybF